MPWQHCGQTLTDDVRCTCGFSKPAWTVKLDKTRLLKLGGDYEGDVEAQAAALEEAAATGTPFCEKCQKTWIAIKLVNADGTPAKDESYKLILASGEERTGKLDQNGMAQVQDYPPGDVKVVFPDRDTSSVVAVAAAPAKDEDETSEPAAEES